MTPLLKRVPRACVVLIGLAGLAWQTPATAQTANIPYVSRLSPISADSGGPAVTLAVSGAYFTSGSVVRWTMGGVTTPLTTSFVSSSEVKASVPSYLLANPGKASVTVYTAGAGASQSKGFTVLLTSISVQVTMSWNTDGEYTALLDLTNTGYRTAPALTVTGAYLNGSPTTYLMPEYLGDLAPGAHVFGEVTFTEAAGPAGDTVPLVIYGGFTGGSFVKRSHTALP